MAESNKQQRTETATAQRRQKAREDGRVLKSQEVAKTAVFVGGLAYLYVLGGDLVEELTGTLQEYLSVGRLEIERELGPLSTDFARRLGRVVMPAMLTVSGAAVIGNLVQSKPIWTLKPLRPKWSQLNPVRGIGQLFSTKKLAELVKVSLKIGLLTAIAYFAVIAELPFIATLGTLPPGSYLFVMSAIFGRVLAKAALLYLLLAILDYLFQRYEYEKSLRMTKQEVKEERKQSEGDPLVRSRIRGRQREMARRRMMEEVPKASVVITNPAHFAIALRYEAATMAAPRVVAKGRDHLARRIREIATRHDVPIVRNPPLARSLYRQVDVGSEIPSDLYKAVAEILAVILRRPSEARS